MQRLSRFFIRIHTRQLQFLRMSLDGARYWLHDMAVQPLVPEAITGVGAEPENVHNAGRRDSRCAGSRRVLQSLYAHIRPGRRLSNFVNASINHGGSVFV
jgi:hypothetical protein